MSEVTQLGPFVIARELGRGGMGVVYAAEHEGREVALKVSLDGLPERDRKHFVEEAELIARVTHPGVVEILDSGTLDDGRPYLVMPLLSGRTLAERLREGPLDVDVALRLFVQLAGAVAALHEAGVVHRDIKPENVMVLEDEERVVLLDFGIARDVDRPDATTTRMGQARGTPSCMAPERFFGTRAGPASDAYELAVVLYAMVAGRLPWDEPTDPEARLRPRSPSALGVDLPAGLEALLMEALSTRPERRPCARVLATRVHAIQAAGPGAEPDPSRTTAPLAPLPAQLSRSTSSSRRAGSIAPPDPPRRRAIAPWIAGAIAVVALAAGSAFLVRAPRASSAIHARGGLGSTARSVAQHVASASAPAASDTAPADANTAAAVASTVPADASAAAAVASTVAGLLAQVSAVPASSSRPASVAAAGADAQASGLPWCTKLVALQCSPAARKLAGGEERCAARREGLARTRIEGVLRARLDAECRDAIPVVEQMIHASKAGEPPEDMPWCKRVTAAYCEPEVKGTSVGASLCAQAQRGYALDLERPPAARVAANERCAGLLPAVRRAMQELVQQRAPATPGIAAPTDLDGGQGARPSEPRTDP
ncbi:serine/threonine protein kinase [Minicystis rosea]|nr:serine/threonine protein kinase [Minicystis rosea]